MSTEVTSPLAELIKRAASQPAPEGPAAKIRKRFEGCTDNVAVLLDVSGSMADCVSGAPPMLAGAAPVSQMTKWDHLQYALRDVIASGHLGLRLIYFGSRVALVPKHPWKQDVCVKCKVAKSPSNVHEQCVAAIPPPGGGTPLDRAIEEASKLKPRKTIIISDGLPDHAEACMEAIETLSGAVDTIYCGPDADPAVQFLRSLARAGAGTHVTWDGYRQLSQTIRGLLPPPA